MSKYVRYIMWLAKAIIAVAAAIAFVKLFMTGEDVYAAMFAADVVMFITVVINERMLGLKRRIEIIESKQRGFMSFETAIAAEQLDCKERVDKLAKMLSGDEQ